MLTSSKILLLATMAGATVSCKGTSSGSDVAGAEDLAAAGTAGAGLDVNDVSILFPLPDSLTELDKMASLSLVKDSGQPLMSRELLADIIKHFNYDAQIDGKTVKFKSGASFAGRVLQSLSGGSHETGPFDKYEEWRIVALRYDPCAPVKTHSLAKQEPREPPAAFSAEHCSPQLRLTAQPLVEKRRVFFGSRADNIPHAGDFAIHMLHSLTEDESKGLYAELRAFRDSCGDVTAGVPLTIQPCLLMEKTSGAYGGPKFQGIVALIKKYTKNYVATAAFASQDGTDPWAFMNGSIQDGKFVHAQIDAVTKDTDLKTNAQGKLIEPFSNGYYEQLRFVDVGAGNPDAPRVSPLPVPGKANTFIEKEYNKGKLERASFFTKINQLESPRHNDFFSTDCASCHSVSDLSVGVSRKELIDLEMNANERRGFPTIVTNQALATNTSSIQQKSTTADFYKVPGYTNVVDSRSISHSPSGDHVFSLMHFGYFDGNPAVSQRAANESAMVAKMANDFYGQGKLPAAACATEALRSCLNSQLVWLFQQPNIDSENPRDPQLYGISYCMQKVCVERAKSLTKMFGTSQLDRSRAIQDVPIFANWGSNLYYIPKGTVVTYYRHDETEPRKTINLFIPELTPIVIRKTQENAFTVRETRPVLPGEWKEYFEDLPKP